MGKERERTYKDDVIELVSYIDNGVNYSTMFMYKIYNEHPKFKQLVDEEFNKHGRCPFYDKTKFDMLRHLMINRINGIYKKIDGTVKFTTVMSSGMITNRHKDAIKYFPEYSKKGQDALMYERIQFTAKYIDEFIRKVELRSDNCKKSWEKEIPDFAAEYKGVEDYVKAINQTSFESMENICGQALIDLSEEQKEK